jgi:copper chaperone NosL
MLIVRGAGSVPDSVQPIDWHKQPCAHCQMLLGEPRHAAQLITTEGDVLSFDDPGCALQYIEARAPHVHKLWFHHAQDDRWLPADDVAFKTGGTTPMASGLLAVDKGTAGALDLSAARARIHEPSAMEMSR